METQVEEPDFSHLKNKIEQGMSIKIANLNLLLDLQSEINKEIDLVSKCMCCGEPEISYLECKSYIDGLSKANSIINEQIKKLK